MAAIGTGWVFRDTNEHAVITFVALPDCAGRDDRAVPPDGGQDGAAGRN